MSRFGSTANASSTGSARFGSNGADNTYAGSNKSTGAVRESRFSAPTSSGGVSGASSGGSAAATGASRFSSNDAYKPSADPFYANSASKFKANGYDNKPKLPIASNPVAAGINYQQAYTGYGAGAETMFSYPPPPIH